eukprot:XP_015580912.1 zinc finger BED domain-containing protein RICESLEEPER 2-like [Ricinus communis]
MIFNAPDKICLTIDNWKSQHTKVEYICITAHFINDKWKLQKRILRFRALVPPYDGLCIAVEIDLFLSQWNLKYKIFSITADNASYNDTMISILNGCLAIKEFLVCNGEFFQIRCCAHILNLIVQSGLDSISDIINKIREIMKYIDKSQIRRKKFFDVAKKSFHLNVRRRFRFDCPTRWNSTYTMLDNALYYKNVFDYFGSISHVLRSYEISEIEWKHISMIHKFLKVFYEVTIMFSAHNTPTLNLFFRGVWKIHSKLLEVANEPSHLLGNTAKAMQPKFDKYWANYNGILSCVALLDPRRKINFLKYCYGKIYGKDKMDEMVEKVVTTLHKLFDEYRQETSSSIRTSNEEPSSGGNFVSDMGDEQFEDYKEFLGETTTMHGKSQLDLYFEEPTHNLIEDLDVLEFWNKSSMRYPEL